MTFRKSVSPSLSLNCAIFLIMFLWKYQAAEACCGHHPTNHHSINITTTKKTRENKREKKGWKWCKIFMCVSEAGGWHFAAIYWNCKLYVCLCARVSVCLSVCFTSNNIVNLIFTIAWFRQAVLVLLMLSSRYLKMIIKNKWSRFFCSHWLCYSPSNGQSAWW